jgi:hypothetical protein
MHMMEPTKEQLLEMKAERFDSDSLRFQGLRGDLQRHLGRAELEAAIATLPPAPLDQGTVDLLVARGPAGERQLPSEVVLTVDGGMPGDRWVTEGRYGPDHQLATARSDFARLVANGQPLELHGDNIFLYLDLSSDNLPPGSLLRLGSALLRVTPVAHNGCKKWVQRFGLSPMQLNLSPEYRRLHLRGIYLQVVEDGRVRVSDPVKVVERAAAR